MSSDNKIYKQTILEIVHLIQDGFAFLPGGRDVGGRPLIIFPDKNVKAEFTDEEFRQMLAYFTTAPPYTSPEDVERGFAIIIDRRSSKWGRVQSLISKLENFFPATIVSIYVIGPSSGFQRLISELRMGLIRTNSSLQMSQLVMINPLSELHSYVDRSQLIRELDGTHVYNHDEWIENRVAVENFAVKEDCVANKVRELCRDLVRMEMPAALQEAKSTVEKKTTERNSLMHDINKSVESGLSLLNDIRCHRGRCDGTGVLTPDKRIHIICIERALNRLQSCRQRFETFWCDHDLFLKWALGFSEFMDEASQIQFKLDDLINAFDRLQGDTSREGVDRGLAELDGHKVEIAAIKARRKEVVGQGEDLVSDLPRLEGNSTNAVVPAVSSEMCAEAEKRSEKVLALCESLPKLEEAAERKLNDVCVILERLQNVYKLVLECQNWRNNGVELLAQHSQESNSIEARKESIAEMKAFLINKPNLQRLETLEEDLPEETKGSVLEIRAAIGQMQTDCERLIEKLNAANNASNATGRGRTSRRESDDAAMRRRKCFTLEGLGKQLSPALYYQDRRKPASVGDETNDDDDEEEARGDASTPNSAALEDEVIADETRRIREKIITWTNSLTVALPQENNCDHFLCPDRMSAEFFHNKKCISATCLSDQESSVDLINGNSSPDAKVDDCDRRLLTRRHVMSELIETERVYVESLQRIYNVFWTEIDNPANGNLVPKELKEDRRSLFGNWEDLLKFHKSVLLKKLETCVDQPGEMSRCFQECRDAFEKYSDYCMNKYYADALLRRLGGDQHPFIRHCQTLLNHNLPLSSFLLKPVQRVQKYQLLLREMLKNTPTQTEESAQLEMALNIMLRILRSLNDSMVLCDIVDYQRMNTRDLGRILLHDTFQVSADQKETKSGRQKLKERHVILFENKLLVCKTRLAGKNQEKVEYHTVHELSMNEIGLTESTKSISDRRFEVWVNNRRLILTLQAPTVEVKQCWTKQLQDLLYAQFERLREKAKMQRDKSNSQSCSAVSSPSPTSKLLRIGTPSTPTPSMKGLRSSTSDDDTDRESGKPLDIPFSSGPYPVTQV